MSKENKTIEQEYFNWDEWNQVDTFSPIFYNCELVKDIADIPAETKVSGIWCDHENSLMRVDFDEEGKDYRVFKLSYSIGEDITEAYKAKMHLADLKREAQDAEIKAQCAKSKFEREQKKLQEEVIQ